MLISAEYRRDIAELEDDPIIHRLEASLPAAANLDSWEFTSEANRKFQRMGGRATTHIGAVAAAIRSYREKVARGERVNPFNVQGLKGRRWGWHWATDAGLHAVARVFTVNTEGTEDQRGVEIHESEVLARPDVEQLATRLTLMLNRGALS